MNRFLNLKGRQALMPFLMLGDPNADASFAHIEAAIAGGADALELGIPFSDPVADGPIIQASAERALKAGMTFACCLTLIKKVRSITDLPIAILTYTNLIFHRGFENALQALHEAGVDALLLADLPFEEALILRPIYEATGVGQVFLIAQNTELARAKAIHAQSSGFTYLINAMGTTGLREGIPAETLTRLASLKEEGGAPIFVGFGIHKQDQVRTLWHNGADGVIIGSKLIDMLAKGEAIGPYLRELKK